MKSRAVFAFVIAASFLAGALTTVATDAQTTKAPLQVGRIKLSEIRTRHIMDGTVTSAKLAFTDVTVNVSVGAATGSSAADPNLVGGQIVGVRSAGNQDQLMDNIVLNGDGSITVTLAANATAQNNFKVFVLKPNTKGTS